MWSFSSQNDIAVFMKKVCPFLLYCDIFHQKNVSSWQTGTPRSATQVRGIYRGNQNKIGNEPTLAFVDSRSELHICGRATCLFLFPPTEIICLEKCKQIS